MAIAEQVAAFKRWQNILRREGLFTSVKRTILFLVRDLFKYESIYLYRAILENEAQKPESTHKTKGLSLKIITTNKQVEELIASGFNFDWFLISADKRLHRGAVALCLFTERQLVYISWLAMNAQAKDAITGSPQPIDFSNKEAYAGWTFKNPKYWRIGGGYVDMYFSIVRFLWQKGFKACHFEIDKKNTISNNTMSKRIHIKPYREARYIKLLWWKFWQEKEIQQLNNQ